MKETKYYYDPRLYLKLVLNIQKVMEGITFIYTLLGT